MSRVARCFWRLVAGNQQDDDRGRVPVRRRHVAVVAVCQCVGVGVLMWQ